MTNKNTRTLPQWAQDKLQRLEYDKENLLNEVVKLRKREEQASGDDQDIADFFSLMNMVCTQGRKSLLPAVNAAIRAILVQEGYLES